MSDDSSLARMVVYIVKDVLDAIFVVSIVLQGKLEQVPVFQCDRQEEAFHPKFFPTVGHLCAWRKPLKGFDRISQAQLGSANPLVELLTALF
jgi:hypothetical protein